MTLLADKSISNVVGFLVGLLMLLGICNVAYASREVSEKRECSTCHIMWLKDFNRKDVTSLIPYEPKPVEISGKQDVSSTNKMCFSCHDGFVLDSRDVWKLNRHNHPVGVKPSEKITIPTSKGKTVFPLNDDGKVYCGTCHTAHGVDWNQTESPVFLRVKNVESSMCLACHLEKSTGPEEGNHPIFKKPPNQPHALIQAGSKFTKSGDVICQSCHSPHAAQNEHILVTRNDNSELCFSCHKDKKGVIDTKHNLARSAPGSLNKKGESATESGVCATCHLPHGGNKDMLWARHNIKTRDIAAARCISCHRDGAEAKDKTTGLHSHPTMVSVEKLGININKGEWTSTSALNPDKKQQPLPLYDSRGHKTLNSKNVGCGTCHDPHVWSKNNHPSLNDDGELIEGNGESSFLRIPQDQNSSLCLNCHSKKQSIMGSKHNVFNNKELSQKDILNGGVCGQCHMPHNARGSYLRAREYKTEHGDFSRLCKSCHKKEGIAENKQIDGHSHPVGIKLEKVTNRKIKLPVYDEDGKSTDENGMVDCATCHDAHNWSPQSTGSEIPDKEGDASNSFLRITASHDSNLCVECHKKQASVLGTDHDMSKDKPKTVNIHNQDVTHSGVCGQCHAVHNATMQTGLWAREPAKVASKVEQKCLSCHSEGNIAAEKVPPKLRHPDSVTAWSNTVREKRITSSVIPDIPVYDSNGKKAHVGLITCLSCHDPHQWQPGKKQQRMTKNQEGDAMNSFLRNANSELIICADCHGADAIFRYKYFHGETSRKNHPLYQ